MKYTILKQFSFINKKFDIIHGSKLVSTVTVKRSKEYKRQYNLKLSNFWNDSTMKECSCIVESHQNEAQHYLIYSINKQTKKKILFGQLLYEIFKFNYLYTIRIQEKIYQIRSTDLKNRRLTIIDSIQLNQNQTTVFNYPEILFQSIETLEKSNEKYRVNVHDKQWPLVYFAITILIHLHESQRKK